MFFGHQRVHALQKIVLFPLLQNQVRTFFLGEGAEFVAGILRENGGLQFPFDGESEPFLGARLELVAHASSKTQRAQKAHGLIGKRMNGKGANFAVLDVREAIRGVEQQSARRRIQRDGNCVERKVAASQILHDGGPANFRARARAHVVVIARGGKTALAIPGEQQFHVTVLFVFRKDSGASFSSSRVILVGCLRP
jgi:hypothetical protein